MKTGSIVAIAAMLGWVWVATFTAELRDLQCRQQLVEATILAVSEEGTDTDIERAERLMEECK